MLHYRSQEHLDHARHVSHQHHRYRLRRPARGVRRLVGLHTVSHRRTNMDTRPYLDTRTDEHSVASANMDSRAGLDTSCHPSGRHRYSSGPPDGHTDTVSAPNRYADNRDSGRPYGHRIADTVSYSHPFAHEHANSDSHSYFPTDTYPKGDAHADTESNAVASRRPSGLGTIARALQRHRGDLLDQ